MLGVLAGSILGLSTLVWLLLSLVALLGGIIIFLFKRSWRLSIILLPFFLFLGAGRYQLDLPVIDQNSISFFNDLDRRVYVTGSVTEPPDVRDTYINLRVEASALDAGSGDLPMHGLVLVRLANEIDVRYGDTVRVLAYLKKPQAANAFSYRDYLTRQGIFSSMSASNITILPGKQTAPFWSLMYRLHDSLLKQVNRLFPNPEASLIASILLGYDKGMPADVKQAFSDTGTSHIIAISGFNISIVASVFIFIFCRLFGKKWGMPTAILGIIIYTLLAGASASVVRAAIMGSMTMIGAVFGRRNLAATGLSSAAFAMTLYNPQVLWDIGFQLSFAAMLGLVIYSQPLEELTTAFLERFFPQKQVERFIGPISAYFLLTFAAQLTTLPISIYHFGRFSLIALAANPLVLSAQPALMILSGAAVTLSKIYLPLGQVIAWAAWPFAAYTIRMAEFFAGFPGGVFLLGEISLLAALFFYVVLFVITFAWSKFKNAATPPIFASLLAVLAFLAWRSIFNLPDGRLHVLFMDVGSADGVLITTPGGRYVLINGGESPSKLADQLGRRIPPFNRGIDSLVVASTLENETGALPKVVEQYKPKTILWAGNPEASFSARELKDWVSSTHTPLLAAETGSKLDLGDGVTLEVLSVSPRGAVLVLEMGSFKTILPIGINFDVLTALENGYRLGPATAVLLADSGYGPSNPEDWLANLQPQMVILSVASDDPDGLPAKDVIKPFENINLLRTDQTGWIDLASNGTQLWVTAQNNLQTVSAP